MIDYGIVGNCKTCALVKKDGSVDWLCYPRFDSPSVFARLLDTEQGGALRVRPVGRYRREQFYWEDTAILETRFTGKSASFQVLDFFPRYRKLLKRGHEKLVRQNRFIRIIRPLKGKPRIRVHYDPKPGYARRDPVVSENDGQLCLVELREKRCEEGGLLQGACDLLDLLTELREAFEAGHGLGLQGSI